MARFCGEIGFGGPTEVAPGVWEDVITDVKFFGDVLQNIHTFNPGDGVNDNPDLNASISIVGNNYAFTHIKNMRYLRWNGVLWILDSIEVKRPRLIVRLGGVYNGPPETTPHAA